MGAHRHLFHSRLERKGPVLRRLEAQRENSAQLASYGGMAPENVEAGLVARQPTGVGPQREEQHARVALFGFGQRVVADFASEQGVVGRHALGVVDVGEGGDPSQQPVLVGPGRRRGQPGRATQRRPRAPSAEDVRQLPVRFPAATWRGRGPRGSAPRRRAACGSVAAAAGRCRGRFAGRPHRAPPRTLTACTESRAAPDVPAPPASSPSGRGTLGRSRSSGAAAR